jgi:hypothetical protein
MHFAYPKTHITTFLNPWCKSRKHHIPRGQNAPPPLHTYCTYSKVLTPPQWCNSPLWTRVSSLPWLQNHTQTHNTHKRQTFHVPGGIQTHNPSKWTGADPCLRLRGHRDWSEFLNSLRICTWLVGRCWYISLLGRTINSCLRTVKKLTKSLPKRLQVNAPKSSCNWFVTG